MAEEQLERPATPTLGPTTSAEAPGTLESLASLGLERHRLSQRALVWRRLRRHRLAMASLVVLGLMGLATALAGLLTPYGYADQNLLDTLAAPSAHHPMGTDTLGRDQLSRLLYGGRLSLLVGIGVALSAGLIGTLVGAVAGFYGGRLDDAVMRLTDLFLSIPSSSF